MQFTSAYYVDDAIWATMTEVCTKTRMIAILLLPTFMGIYFCVQYTKEGYRGENSRALIIATIAKGLCLTLFICCFEEIMEKLDDLTVAIMDELGVDEKMQDYLEMLQENIEANKDESFCGGLGKYSIKSILNTIKNFVLDFLQMFARGTIHAIRSYLLMFSTQVGPLAIAMSALPGRYSSIAANWFSLQLSFFMWGVSISIIDLTLIQLKIETIVDQSMLALLGYVAIMAMYLIVGTMTGLYIGNVTGGSIFNSTANFAVNQIINGGKALYKLKKRFIG